MVSVVRTKGWATQPLRIQLVTAYGVCLLLFIRLRVRCSRESRYLVG